MDVVALAIAAAVGALAGWGVPFLYRRLSAPHPPAPSNGRTATAPAPERRAPPARPPEPTTPPPAVRVARPEPRVSDGARAAARIMLHLYSLGRLEIDGIGTVGFTQRGIGDALGMRQGTVAKVLGRLAAAGIVESDRRHISGEARRLLVYRLTRAGELVARDLQRRELANAEASGPREFRLGEAGSRGSTVEVK
jgi:DNA-binding MarR family transcriptional regulator